MGLDVRGRGSLSVQTDLGGMSIMERKLVLVFAGAFALAAVAGTAMAAGVPDTATKKCGDKLQNETLKYVNAVQKQIRLSIKNNLNGKDSKCSGGLACAGGANNNHVCTTNANCPSGQCAVNNSKGIAGAIIKAKATLRAKIFQFCTDAQLVTLGFPSSRCPDPDSPVNGLDRAELADCILHGAVGDLSTAVFGDVSGEVLGRASGRTVPQAVPIISVCGVTLASVLSIGSASTSATIAEAGGAQPVVIDGPCVGTLCQTKGSALIGNNLTSPTQTFAGLIPICLVTVTGNAGNGTNEDGSIDVGTGEQHSFAPILSTVLIGTTCPTCDTTTATCNGGPNNGLFCTNKGGTDTACPPTTVGGEPVIPNPLDLDTEANTLAVPAHNPAGGVTNPAGTFCGSCDLDPSIGCNNDSVCVAAAVCSGGVGSGCCSFGTNAGAFGVPSATSVTANGVRGPYIPRLATIFCTGQSGNGLVDSTQGLPGPVRLVQQQLNAFEY
jgi:hypothetical protein